MLIVGVSGMGPCVLLADDKAEPVRPAILYGVDSRAGEQIEQLNAEIRYVAYSVYASVEELGDADRQAIAAEVREALAPLEAKGLVVRGTYDVSAFRADADLLVWWHAPTSELIQEAYAALRRSRLGAALESVW